MAPSQRPEHHINLAYLPQLSANPPHSASSSGAASPVEPPSGGRFPAATSNPLGAAAAGARLGSGSPSHEYSGRLFSKRFVALVKQRVMLANLERQCTRDSSAGRLDSTNVGSPYQRQLDAIA